MDNRHVDRAMQTLQNTQQASRIPAATNVAPEDEVAPEADEPPDELHHLQPPMPFKLPSPTCGSFGKTGFPSYQRRESLITQALHFKEPENTTSHVHPVSNGPLSRATTSCSASTTSTAELTSDDGLTSPGMRTNSPSPPLPATSTYSLPRLNSKRIGHENHAATAPHNDPISISSQSNDPPTERAVEATLGRKRCIKFACGRKESVAGSPPQKPADEESQSRCERRRILRFMCPRRNSPTNEADTMSKPMQPRPTIDMSMVVATSPKRSPVRPHRNSDSTIKNESPKSSRKSAAASARKRYQESLDLGHTSATRFHEFASSEEEMDDWVQESTCHRSRLTVNDTLGKENVIRQLGREAEEEEEALDDEEIIDNDAQNEDEDEDQEGDENEDTQSERERESESGAEEEDEEAEEHVVTDDGFQTDDENGFANTDDESDTNSDYRWWAPDRSTAATSTEHLEHIRPLAHRNASNSSIGSVGSGHERYRSPHPNKFRQRSHSKTGPVDIGTNPPDLPDSTDFVCGTLDEDRPLEEAYLSCMEQRKAAKRKAVPQDIDPSFPTSDPELDEEDEEEEDTRAHEEGDHPFLTGHLEIHDTETRGRSVADWRKASSRHSPTTKPSSPPKRLTARSPPPPPKHTIHRSPPPPKRPAPRSPPPSRRLFGQSPKRLRSPPPTRRLKSPPPSRRSSFDRPDPPKLDIHHMRLAQRPQLMHTASLPHTPGVAAKALATYSDDESDKEAPPTTTRSRGAIDIVKGLEKKRQLRKEKLYQKYCSRAGKDKERKPKPGKGCERMRQLGLEAARYRGKRSECQHEQKEPHMLSL